MKKEFERIYLNSDGASRKLKSTHANLYLYARAEENNNKPRSSGAIRIANGIDELDINGCIEEAAQRKRSKSLTADTPSRGRRIGCVKHYKNGVVHFFFDVLTG